MNIRTRRHGDLYSVSIEVLGETFQGLSRIKHVAFSFAMKDALLFVEGLQ